MTRVFFTRAQTRTRRRAVALFALVAACEEGGEPNAPASTGTSTAAALAGAADTPVGWCSVKKILDRACIACHANPPINNAPLSLTSYAELAMVSPLSPDLKVYQSVVETIRAPRGALGRYSPMPPAGPLPPADVELIARWAAQGAPVGASPVCTP